MNTLQTIVAFLAALTLLIFVHEMGHYLVARWCDVKVLRFSIGSAGRCCAGTRAPIAPNGRSHRSRSGATCACSTSATRLRSDRAARIAARIHPQIAAATFGDRHCRTAGQFLLAIVLYATMGWVGMQDRLRC